MDCLKSVAYVCPITRVALGDQILLLLLLPLPAYCRKRKYKERKSNSGCYAEADYARLSMQGERCFVTE